MATKDTKSGIPQDLEKFFKKHDMIGPHIEFHILSLVTWSILCAILLHTLLSMGKGGRPEPFLVMLCALSQYVCHKN